MAYCREQAGVTQGPCSADTHFTASFFGWARFSFFVHFQFEHEVKLLDVSAFCPWARQTAEAATRNKVQPHCPSGKPVSWLAPEGQCATRRRFFPALSAGFGGGEDHIPAAPSAK